MQLSERRASNPREDVTLELGRVCSPVEALPLPVGGVEGPQALRHRCTAALSSCTRSIVEVARDTRGPPRVATAYPRTSRTNAPRPALPPRAAEAVSDLLCDGPHQSCPQ